MPCTGRYAEAIDYAVLMRCAGLYAGLDDSGGAGNVFLTDSTVNFVDLDVVVGNPIFNATTGVYGTITAVAATVLQTNTATWSNGDAYRIALMSASEVATVEMYLDLATPAIFAALGAVGACSCTFASWANQYLAQLNSYLAAVVHHCPCGRGELTDDMRRAYLEWTSEQLELIRTGKIELCSGYTGADYPAIASAEQAWTNWRAAEIMRDTERRTP